jgi:hypothetical protein
MDWLSLMFGTAGKGWIDGAFVLGLFWAALSQPCRIRNLGEFRIAVVFFGLSLVLPVSIQLAMIGNTPAAGRPLGAGPTSLAIYAMAIPPFLMMVAVILAIDSIIPRRRPADTE